MKSQTCQHWINRSGLPGLCGEPRAGEMLSEKVEFTREDGTRDDVRIVLCEKHLKIVQRQAKKSGRIRIRTDA